MNLAKYAKVFDAGIQNTFVYRWNFILRSVFGIVPLIGTIFLWRAMYGDDAARQLSGYTFSALITYFAMTVFVENLITPTEDEWQIAGEIRDGKLSALLLKPINYLGYRFALYTSYRALYSAVILPGVLLIFFFLRSYITLPNEVLTWLAFTVSTVLAGLLQFLIAYAVAMLAFWILEITTIVFIIYSLEYFLSGRVFPLDMLPAWVQPAVKWSPFTYEMYFPVQVFMGRVTGSALSEGILIQAAWVIILYAIATVMWRAGLKRYQAVGG